MQLNNFYMGQPWRDILKELPGAIPGRQDFDEMSEEDKQFFSTLLGVLQDCACYNLYDNHKWQNIGQRLFGLSWLPGSFLSVPVYQTLNEKTFPTVVGWAYVKGPLREERLLRYLRTLAPLLLCEYEGVKPHPFIQKIGHLLIHL